MSFFYKKIVNAIEIEVVQCAIKLKYKKLNLQFSYKLPSIYEMSFSIIILLHSFMYTNRSTKTTNKIFLQNK